VQLKDITNKLHPAVFVLASFLALIGLGTILLVLPVSTASGSISWIDALFTAASAVCVTGLIVVDTGSFFSQTGQIIILVLIQIGGLGVMTLSVVMYRWLRRSISYRQRRIMQDLLTHTPREDIFNLVFSVLKFTAVIELLGAVALTIFWSREMPFQQAMYTSIFHAVSAFCNAGFSLFSDSLVRWSSSYAVNTVMGLLIIFGGIGFPVLYEVEQVLIRKTKYRLSVHTRTVLTATAILIFGGAVLLSFSSFSGASPSAGAVQEMSGQNRILAALFQSVTARTAGFNTINIVGVGDLGITLLLFLMFVGASPGSCGGGVKTTTLAMLFAAARSRIKGKARVNLYKKSIPEETVIRSLTLVVLAASVISLIFFLLLAFDNGRSPEVISVIEERGAFLPYLFEAVSAFGTVGLSMGITPFLSTAGKWLIIVLMVIGRVGVLTFSYIITGTKAVQDVEYAEENIMIG